MPKKRGQKGGKLSIGSIKKFVQSFKNPKDNIDDYILDENISNSTAKTYYNPLLNHAVVVHSGTQSALDWGNNVMYMIGAYKITNRYKSSQEIQELAEQKYGSQNVSTVGFSQGGILARELGGNSKEIINVNPAYKFESQKPNEYNIRSSGDVVSGLLKYPTMIKSWFYPTDTENKNITIPAESYDPLLEHSSDILDRLPQDQQVGEGLIFKIRLR